MKPIAIALLLATAAFAQAPVRKPGPASRAQPAATGYVANKASKVYHRPDCKVGIQIKPENKVMVATKADAEKAGYKACRVCKP